MLPVRRLVAVVCGLLPALACAAPPGDGQAADLTALSIEELLAVEVYSASKFVQKTAEAPAAVTVITAADIKAYGYRSLADVLNGVRGLFVTNDRNYQYLGIRGFNRPGEYNSRILLLVDGYRLNDAIYDTASIGGEFFLDPDLIDRVEVVRGAGSSVYGSNAFFGVVNVVTRRPQDLDGWELAAAAGSSDGAGARASFGRQLENGAGVLLSVSGLASKGKDLYFPEFDAPATGDGIARGRDKESATRFYGRLTGGGFTATAAWSERVKAVPTAAFGSVFNDPRTQTNDAQALVDLGYQGRLGERSDVAARVFYGGYFYRAAFPWDQPPVTVNKEDAAAEWWGAEARLVAHLARHKLVGGVEYQDNYRQDMRNFDVAPHFSYLDERHRSSRSAVYVQDETTLGERFLLNAGLRYDHYSTAGGTFNPRLALIVDPKSATTLKFIYGTAFRAPNALELYYSSPSLGSKPSGALEPEEVSSFEFVAEYRPQPNFRLAASAYFNDVRHLISQGIDPADGLSVYRNLGQVHAKGAEFEAERAWPGGQRLRASYAWQITRDQDTGTELENSPRQLAKLNFALPVWGDALQAGVEVQYMSSRRTLAGGRAGAYTVANLTLLSRHLAKNLDVSLSAYNLFDRRYVDPGRPEHVQDVIAQDGRSFRLKLDFRF